MNPNISGIHHITAITADAQKNIDFYTGVMGLRLVKLTVNFDDPGSYHLYYGDDLGHPGTILTFFAWPGAYRGRIGPPQVTTIAFAAPAAAHSYWTERLREHGVAMESSEQRLGEQAIRFSDPEELKLELVLVPHASDRAVLTTGPVPVEYAIRGFHGATISEESQENTAALLTQVMGFRAAGGEGDRSRYRATGGDGFAATIDLLRVPDAPVGSMGAGVVHHIAFRTPDDPQQEVWRQRLLALGYNVTPVIDRQYFHSIYYPEPGGVLFEIATEPPGFTVDQKPEELGARLMLPPWLEPERDRIERVLPAVRLPSPHAEMHHV